MSHRQKIVYMQIGAITVAIFLALLVGAAALTKALNRREAQTDQKNAKQEQQEEKIASEDDNSADSTSGDSRNEPTTPEPTGEPVSITVSMVGDCTLGTDINFDQSTSFDAFYQMKNDPGYFFQNVKEIFTADDLTVANMEGTLTTSDARQEKHLLSKEILLIQRSLPGVAWRPPTLPTTTVMITEIRVMKIRFSIWRQPELRLLAMIGQP